jgi:hypothetical protein
MMRSFIILLFVKYNYNDEVEEDEMGRACRTNGVKRNPCRYWWGSQKGKRPL